MMCWISKVKDGHDGTVVRGNNLILRFRRPWRGRLMALSVG